MSWARRAAEAAEQAARSGEEREREETLIDDPRLERIRKERGERLEAEREERRKRREKLREEARLEWWRKRKKRERIAFLRGGGTEKEFESQWPSIRQRIIEERAEEAKERMPGVVAGIWRNARSDE
jgi:hypothetical protein